MIVVKLWSIACWEKDWRCFTQCNVLKIGFSASLLWQYLQSRPLLHPGLLIIDANKIKVKAQIWWQSYLNPMLWTRFLKEGGERGSENIMIYSKYRLQLPSEGFPNKIKGFIKPYSSSRLSLPRLSVHLFMVLQCTAFSEAVRALGSLGLTLQKAAVVLLQ